MKKLLPIGYIMIAVLIILTASMRIIGPIIGNIFSEPNNSLAGVSYMPMATASVYDQVTNSNDGSSVPAPSVERIVIQNADLTIVVADVQVRMKDIQVMADKMGGFVVLSNLYQRTANNNVQVPEAVVVIRVPSEKLEDALNQIKKDTVEVQTETRSGQDVTAEYVDLKSRLKNLEEAEAQLSEILKNTINTEEVVSIFNQLVAYREQIEVIKGQIKYYDEAAALSAISVHIIAEATVQPLVIGKWEPKGVALEAVQDLINFLKGFVNFLIRFVIYILPVLILIAIPLYLVFIGARAVIRKFNKSLPEQHKSASKYVEINSSEIDEITDIVELEQKIKDGETLLIEAKGGSFGGWAPLIVSLGIIITIAVKIPLSEIYLIFMGFGLAYLGFNIWRIYNANKQKKMIESKLNEYRDKKAELRKTAVEK